MYFKKIKMKIRILSLTAIFSALLLAGCNKSILNINTNPNNPTTSTPQLLLPGVLVADAAVPYSNYTVAAGGTSGAGCGLYDVGDWMGYMAGQMGFSPIVQLQTYQINTSFFVSVWGNYYLDIGNYCNIKQLAKQENLPFYTAVANIMMAYDFSCLVDCYNNVPYSDAMLNNGNLTPKYDNASDVYDSCVVLIDSAVSLLQDPSTTENLLPADDAADIIYGTNPTQWIKFANSLKLRLLLNQSQVLTKSNVSSTKIAFLNKEIAELKSATFMGIGDDALVNPPYQNTSGKTNPLYGAWYTTPGISSDLYKMHSLNAYALNVYQSNNDPRLSFFYDTIPGGLFAANVFGASVNVMGSPLGTTTADINKILNPIAPAPILTAAEALFDKAEAIARGWLSGDAQTAYTDAITASFQYTGMADSVNSYLAEPNVVWGAMPAIQQIITQKWAAMNSIDILRAYDDYRRTGYPSNIPLSIASGHLSNIPYRFMYPYYEYTTNAANVNAQGNITAQSKIFWMP